MRHHYFSKHKDHLFTCSKKSCNKYFIYLHELENHMKKNHPSLEEKVQCCYCAKMLSAHNLGLERHIERVHPENSSKPMIFSCSQPSCEKVFSSVRFLRQHERKHKSISESKCTICGGTYKCLLLHMKFSHPEKDNYAYLHRKKGKTYERKNTPIQCDLCGKTLARVSALKVHKNVVHKRIRHKCPSCDKDYSSLGDMRYHFRAVHEGITWPCRFCSVVFLRGPQRNQHEKQEHPDQMVGGSVPME